MVKRVAAADDFWDRPLAQLLTKLEATPFGLTDSEAKRRLRVHGPNSLARESRFGDLFKFLRLFANPLVIILLAASTAVQNKLKKVFWTG